MRLHSLSDAFAKLLKEAINFPISVYPLVRLSVCLSACLSFRLAFQWTVVMKFGT